MKTLFSKPVIFYCIGLLLLVLLTGFVLYPFVENFVVLGAVLSALYVVLIMILLYVFDTYIKPVQKVTKTINQLVKGNYRARVHHPITGSIGELSSKVNALARSLSELSIHEKIQSEQFSTVIDNTQSGLALVDEKGYIHLVNRKFLTMFGKTTKDYVGYLYYDVITNEKIHRAVQDTFLYEDTVKNSITHNDYYIEIVGAPISNERGMIKGAVLVFYDITELKKLEVMRKDFVANVSHELKTPMTSITGFAETLKDGALEDPETSKQFVQIIYDESKRLQAIIEDLLALSKLEKEEFHLDLVEINVKEIVNEVMPVINQQAERKQINFSLDCEQEFVFKADYDRVKQVLINLLMNGVNYTPEKGNVHLEVNSTEEHVHFRVTDTGIGIPKDALHRIFERFYRVDAARSRNTGGTGLGLAIVKHIMDVHDGTIEINSEVDKGTKVDVYFPRNIDK
ncbi:two-component system histidine kinase PnpS [Ornithinibacillus halophilus]|uniref:histidine kinase n=1 Tax=Ornithinibacillus halophilus TaxID=930117 RepID=A0A1M5EFI4_9BACI|nr:HAMP domain-containing sensor histidine kinase [Ornithinibacillus halophilus]SHF77989.1 PAS/PAC sensor signal transduction histidine kinase [Ornithinibacillus halophilus]